MDDTAQAAMLPYPIAVSCICYAIVVCANLRFPYGGHRAHRGDRTYPTYAAYTWCVVLGSVKLPDPENIALWSRTNVVCNSAEQTTSSPRCKVGVPSDRCRHLQTPTAQTMRALR